MTDPQSARLNQLRNIQARSGKTIAALHSAIAKSGLTKTGEQRSLLMEKFQLGYGDANMVALHFGKPLPDLAGTTDAGLQKPAPQEALDAIYTGPKAHLRTLHEAVMAVLVDWGEFEQAPKKSYISLRRKKQFAMLGPATKEQIEIGFNAKDLPHHARLKVQPPGAMCQATTRIGSIQDIDTSLKAWLKLAFDASI
jgi:hypothetical protein